MARFTNLLVWQQARVLLRTVSAATADMRREGDLLAQMRRAAISVASNIAEGAERGSDRQFLQFLRQADGSNAEIQAQAIIAGDCGCLGSERVAAIVQQAQIVGRMLNRLMRRLGGDG